MDVNNNMSNNPGDNLNDNMGGEGYICPNCQAVFDVRFGACPRCGMPVKVNAEQGKKKMSSGKLVIIIVSIVLACLVALGGIAFAMIALFNKTGVAKKDTSATVNAPTQDVKLTEQEIINACDLIDYSVIADAFDSYVPSSYKGAMQTLVTDADDNGRLEMFVDIPMTDNSNDRNSFSKTGAFWFDIANPNNSSYDYTAKADTYEFYTDDDGNVYYIGLNSLKGYSETISKWTSNGFVEIGYYLESWEREINENVFREANFNGKTLSSFDEFNAEKSKLGLKRISGSNSRYLSNYFYTSKPEDVIGAYKNRITGLNNGSRYISQDYDNDGEDEYLFIVRYSTDSWLDVLLEAQNREQTKDWEDYEPYVPDENYDYRREGYVYADVDEKGVVFHCVTSTYVDHGYETNISWNNSTLKIEFLVPYSEPIICEYFCESAKDTRVQLERNDNEYGDIAKRYIDYIYNRFQGVAVETKPVIKIKYSDLCDIPGKECVLVVNDCSGSYVEVCTFYCGRVVVLYRLYENEGSVFLTNIGGKEHIMYYSQERFDDFGVGTNYCYKTIRFNQNCRPIYHDYQSITIYDNTPPTENHNAFFNGFNALLATAKVCLDNYELTGYKYMQESDINVSGDEQSKYLVISNCNRTKSGFVHIQDIESWLNFREGPSTKYNKILLDSADSKSFVKQAKGSAVTVIDTVNTGDEKNPVWVKIQIKYADRTLVGYSSQNYIDIPSIKHIGVGESFAIAADTNDSGLSWSCNDSSVLSVDRSTGRVTGVKRGLVLVTVRSSSGLSDSCLVMVD